MRIGAICRCDTQGLGIQSKEFFDHIPCKALVVDISKVNPNMKQNHNWYPNQKIVYYTKNARFPVEIVKEFLMGIDILISFETPYDFSIFSLCKLMKVKTILQLNYEFLEYPSSLPPPDLFAMPSLWQSENIPNPKVFLPVPVNTNHFTPTHNPKTFLHIAGKPAIHDRNGTYSLFNCLKYIKEEITLIVKCQQRLNIPVVSENITLITDFKNSDNYWDNYKSGGVLVMPRKYGGLCLGVNEAIGNEMPVIMTDISPNNLWLPEEWLIPAIKTGSFKCKKMVDIFEAESFALAKKIEQFCDADFYNAAIDKAKELKNKISWETLLPVYYKTFESLLNN